MGTKTTQPQTSPTSPPTSPRRIPYEPPRIEDDLPLEVMSLACQGFLPKAASPLPCRTAGSLGLTPEAKDASLNGTDC